MWLPEAQVLDKVSQMFVIFYLCLGISGLPIGRACAQYQSHTWKHIIPSLEHYFKHTGVGPQSEQIRKEAILNHGLQVSIYCCGMDLYNPIIKPHILVISCRYIDMNPQEVYHSPGWNKPWEWRFFLGGVVFHPLFGRFYVCPVNRYAYIYIIICIFYIYIIICIYIYMYVFFF
jgi:hypothetical protein